MTESQPLQKGSCILQYMHVSVSNYYTIDLLCIYLSIRAKYTSHLLAIIGCRATCPRLALVYYLSLFTPSKNYGTYGIQQDTAIQTDPK